MRSVYAHFPINIEIKEGGRMVEIRNFLGERRVRKINLPFQVKCEKNEKTKDEITLKGADIKLVSAGAASIQQLCLVKNKDIRKFLDGIYMRYKNSEQEEKKKLESEKIFFQGPPSISELLIPTISILTVIGIIPFIATLSRQFWVRYTITNRRISVDSGFQGKNRVEIVYRDIKKVSHLTRLGGLTADVVIILKDNARLELRSLPNWKENKEFIQANSSNKSEEK